MSCIKNDSNDTAVTTEKEAKETVDDTIPTLTLAIDLQHSIPCSEIPNITNTNQMFSETSAYQYAVPTSQYVPPSCQYVTSSTSCQYATSHQYTPSDYQSTQASYQYSDSNSYQANKKRRLNAVSTSNDVETTWNQHRAFTGSTTEVKSEDDIPWLEYNSNSFAPLVNSELQRYMQNISDDKRGNSFFNTFPDQPLENNTINGITETHEVEVKPDVLADEKHSVAVTDSKKLDANDFSDKDDDGDT